MGAEWAVLIGTIASAIIATFGTALVTHFTQRSRVRLERKMKADDLRAAAFSDLLHVYAATEPLLDEPDEPQWVTVASLAGKCIPWTAPDSQAREAVLALASRERVPLRALIDALTAEPS